jgi:23S rRNA (uracil1939-C5)-methyltransferase
MQPGAVLEVEIEKPGFRGVGLARHAGQVVLVHGAYPGERWRVKVTSAGRQYLRADAEQLLIASPARRSSPCTVFPECGGCRHQDLGYDEQLELKRAVLTDTLDRARAPRPEQIRVIGSPERGWRTRASLHVEARRDGVHLGLTAAGSHRVVDFPLCLQLSESANRVVHGLRAALERERGLAGRLARVELAESEDAAVCIAALAGDLTGRDRPSLAALAAAVPGLHGLGAAIQSRGGQRFLRIAGETHVAARVGPDELRAHVLSFFQANRFLLTSLLDEVAAGIPEGARVLDLYGGVGLFAVPLARRAQEVLCVEIDPYAAEDARANAERSGLANLKVLRGDVRRAFDGEDAAEGAHVVLDPPRTGLDPEVVTGVARLSPAGIVYVSCDPPTLGRDLARFAALGYRSVRMTMLDLFPDTFHLETVAQLERTGDKRP